MFQPYSPDEWEQLREKYTPAQINAIQAAEEAVDPQDLAQSKIRTNDPWAIDYDDDFSAHHPVLDKRVNPSEETNYDPKLRFKTDEEIKQDFTNFIASLGKDEKDLTGLEYQQFRDNQRIMVGKAQAEHNPINYLAPAIPKEIDGLAEMATIEPVDAIPEEDRILLRQTGYTREEVRGLKSKILVTHRVMNQTRLGKIQSIYVLMVVGNTKGLVGIGEGKTADSKDAIKQARNAALRGMVPIQRYERRTIFGDVKGKVGATQLELMNRPPGIPHSCYPSYSSLQTPSPGCMHLIYEICKCAGIEDLAARVTRARNPMNVVKATMQALTNQRTPDEMARGLGRKLVDVRKVYYGGVDNLQAQITT
ncbi:uncharacterized protein KY384_007950 [Bacidia gigantensis]|uniref:uncharacterized protein n=1 Tax=Bacidia gigantensis TaxID=2732470 RepID=UPI001D050EF7|nr:uncharacterized protein KY384_007950 [Bacidia gigantensis]KAG8527796.1 hypothetical protein KY384_007950 [Bacidia gigantensis]